MMDFIVEKLRDTTLRISSADPSVASFGTGFFVAQGVVLTCGHVVSNVEPPLQVEWNGRVFSVLDQQLLPPENSGDRMYLLPDLALLTIDIHETHPVALLSKQGPMRKSSLVGMGYSRFYAPRSEGGLTDHVAENMGGLTEVTLDIAGRDGDCWRVTDDMLGAGMSGGPVICLETGRVVGLLKAKITDSRSQFGGGWIIGTELVSEVFPGLIGANNTRHPPGTPWWDHITRRAESVNRIFGAHRESASAEVRLPSWLLDPRNSVVPFVETAEFDSLVEWCLDESPGVPAVRLLHAAGGTGKTRLALQISRTLDELGWVAGVLAAEDRVEVLIDQLPDALARGHRVFAAIDYAETNILQMRRLINCMSAIESDHVRLLLLARSPGRWWETLAPSLGAVHLIDPEPLRLSDIGKHDPFEVADSALASFVDRLQMAEPQRGELLSAKLRSFIADHTRALDLHAAALVVALDDLHGVANSNVDRPDPLHALLVHERSYWRRAVAAQTGSQFAEIDRLSDRVLALPTLLPALDQQASQEAIARIPIGREALPCGSHLLAAALAQLYPGLEDGYWGPLVPDRLGEALLSEVIGSASSSTQACGELEAAIGDVTVEQAMHAMTVLARIAGLADNARRSIVSDRVIAILDRLVLSNPAVYLPAAVSTAAIVEDTEPLRAIVESVTDKADLETLQRSSESLPDFHEELIDLAITIESRRVERLRALPDDGEARLSILADSLNEFAHRLADGRKHAAALKAASDAASIRRRLVTHDSSPSSRLELARTLNSLGLRLAEAGEHSDALAVSQEAAKIYRDLASDDPTRMLPDLAASLSNLGSRLLSMGRSREALSATEEATGVYCNLAIVDPKRWLPDLVVLLVNLGTLLADVGRLEEAFAVTDEAVHICRDQFHDASTIWSSALALALNGLGVRLARLGRIEEALAATGEAALVRRQLAAANPTVWSPDLAMSLNNLGVQLALAGRAGEALDVSEEALLIRRQLDMRNPGIWELDLAISLQSMSNRLAAVGRISEALDATAEALSRLRGLEVRSSTSTTDIALSLTNFSLRQAAAGNVLEALAASANAVAACRTYSGAFPDTNSHLALVLNNHSNRLAAVGWTDEALAVAETATLHYWRRYELSPYARARELIASLENLSLRLDACGWAADALLMRQKAAALRSRLGLMDERSEFL